MTEGLPPPPGVFRRLRKNRTAFGALLLLSFIVGFTILWPCFMPYEPGATSGLQFAEPGLKHWFGTDINGRDMFARTLQGARISLIVGAAGAVVSLFVGTSYGLISGYFGGKVDDLMMRLLEILYAIPRLLLVMIAIFAFDMPLRKWMSANGLTGLISYSRVILLVLVLGLNAWLNLARVVRGQVLSLKTQQFVLAARSLGQSHFMILVRHLLPNLSGIIVVYITLTVPQVILDESFLSFLGVGIQDPLASWGTLLSAGASAINTVRSYWWLLLFPAGAMSLTLLALNFLGDGLRDALDPRQKR